MLLVNISDVLKNWHFVINCLSNIFLHCEFILSILSSSKVLILEGNLVDCCFGDLPNLVRLRLGTHLFVKIPWPGDSEKTFSVLSQAGTCYYQSNHSKLEAFPECLAKVRNKRTYRPIFTLSLFNAFLRLGRCSIIRCWVLFFIRSLMLNVKQGSCEYQLLKSFGLTGWWCYPTPSEGWERGWTLRRPNSRTTP